MKMNVTKTITYELTKNDVVQIIRDHFQKLTGDLEAQRASVVFDEPLYAATVTIKHDEPTNQSKG